MATGNGTFSVIGSDVTIKGDIVASADLHVDGRIEGDIACASLVQGESSVIVGTITTETARLSGTINGSISARDLTVLRTARIEGDVQYDALTIEQGAEVEGRFSHRVSSKAADTAAGNTPKPTGDDEPRLTLAS
ncbi:cell shape determination protein CcmA [Croceicoccus estronivorus]|uniref:bactofilin family protein n=1 Tax=Croceicoccus estronivorus TaxID=1172626 RepID=UPI0008351A5F|nr:polymer-forming cytoskeletal protein [Croceicoccus estronivorus]OCC24022.1 cell shape determination protein CcmA [Croceicoccus estronivorus]